MGLAATPISGVVGMLSRCRGMHCSNALLVIAAAEMLGEYNAW